MSNQKQPTGTEAAVCSDIASRQALGIAKYGTTVAQNPLELRQWLQHQYEELLDAAVYCKRALEELDKKKRLGVTVYDQTFYIMLQSCTGSSSHDSTNLAHVEKHGSRWS